MCGWAETRDERSHTMFLIIYAIERLLKTFRKRMKLDGEIIAAHSLSLIVTAHVPFNLSALGVL
jgi:hypothetical protein